MKKITKIILEEISGSGDFIYFSGDFVLRIAVNTVAKKQLDIAVSRARLRIAALTVVKLIETSTIANVIGPV
jgi:hypothetical protein